ncbi:MAG: DUF3180 domain-containing protein [Micrococcales bacterium]
MKPTRVTNLLTAFVIVAGVGFFVIRGLVGSGQPTPTIGLNLVLIQPTLAIILLLSAIPMIRYRRGLKKFESNQGKRPVPVDSRYAIRTLALAKAFSLTGSITGGWSLAVLSYQFTSPETSRLAFPILGLLGALLMVAAGLYTENLFRIPPEKDGDAA